MAKRGAMSAFWGGTIAYYDFVLFATGSAIIFTRVFFGGLGSTGGLLASLATFGVAYVARPLGAIVPGSLGDKRDGPRVVKACAHTSAQEAFDVRRLVMLYPLMTPTRTLIDLGGVWNFKLDHGVGFDEAWYAHPLQATMPMPVPASFNDVAEDTNVRDHIGWVWYERELVIPAHFFDQRIWLRFGAVTHTAKVYVNGQFASEQREDLPRLKRRSRRSSTQARTA